MQLLKTQVWFASRSPRLLSGKLSAFDLGGNERSGISEGLNAKQCRHSFLFLHGKSNGESASVHISLLCMPGKMW